MLGRQGVVGGGEEEQGRKAVFEAEPHDFRTKGGMGYRLDACDELRGGDSGGASVAGGTQEGCAHVEALSEHEGQH